MSEIRPYKSLAQDLGVTERTFARWLDAGDPRARSKLSEEIAYVFGQSLSNAVDSMRNAAEIVERCEPDLSKLLTKMAAKLDGWHEACPESIWRKEHDKRLDALLNLDDLPDEDYNRFAADFSKLPPTPAEWRAQCEAEDKPLEELM